MNHSSVHKEDLIGAQPVAAGGRSPILLIPYTWIGDFVRCHSAVKLLRTRWPDRPVDILTSTLCSPLLDYMPGVRQGIVWDLPRNRLPLGQYRALAERLRRENYGSALVIPRTWKSALAPFLAGIPERIGFVGEGRFLLINDLRFGERKLPRMIDRCAALALPKEAALPANWPLPEIVVPDAEVTEWRTRWRLTPDARPIVMLAPGAAGPGKRWPIEHYAKLARQLVQDGTTVCVLGGPLEKPLAADIIRHGGERIRDLTGTDLRDAALALKAADLTVANDSGLMHVSAAIGTPTIGIFGPTDPRLWAPLNPLAAVAEPDRNIPCPTCGKAACGNVRHRSTSEIPSSHVIEIARRCLRR